MRLDFPDRATHPELIAEYDQLNFLYGLDLLQEIVDYWEETDGEEILSALQASDDSILLEKLQAAVSMRLARGHYVRPGIFAGVEGAVALETGAGIVYEPLGDDCYVAGEIAECRIEHLPDIGQTLAGIDKDTADMRLRLLVRLKDACIYEADEFGVTNWKYSFDSNVYIPVGNEDVAHPMLLSNYSLPERRQVHIGKPKADRYRELFGAETLALLEALEPGCMVA